MELIDAYVIVVGNNIDRFTLNARLPANIQVGDELSLPGSENDPSIGFDDPPLVVTSKAWRPPLSDGSRMEWSIIVLLEPLDVDHVAAMVRRSDSSTYVGELNEQEEPRSAVDEETPDDIEDRMALVSIRRNEVNLWNLQLSREGSEIPPEHSATAVGLIYPELKNCCVNECRFDASNQRYLLTVCHPRFGLHTEDDLPVYSITNRWLFDSESITEQIDQEEQFVPNDIDKRRAFVRISHAEMEASGRTIVAMGHIRIDGANIIAVVFPELEGCVVIGCKNDRENHQFVYLVTHPRFDLDNEEITPVYSFENRWLKE